MSKSKILVFWTGLFAFLIVFLFVVGEVLLRFISSSSTKYGYFPHPPLEQVYHVDSIIGWKHYPGEFTYRKPEFETQIKINNTGFRSSEEYRVGSKKDNVIAIIGDSFVQALQVHESKTFPKLLENKLKNKLNAQVQNYGVSDIGTPHYLQIYRNEIRKRKPKWVVISLLDVNDIRNSSPDLEVNNLIVPQYKYDLEGNILEVDFFGKKISEKKRALHKKVDTLTSMQKVKNKVYKLLKKNSSFFRWYLMTKAKMEITNDVIGNFPMDGQIYEEPWEPPFASAWKHSKWSLKKLFKEIKKDSATPILVYMAGRWTTDDKTWELLVQDYNGKNKLSRYKLRDIVEIFCNEQDVEFVDLTSTFKLAYEKGDPPFWESDGHLNEFGHRLVTDRLSKYWD